MIDPIYPPSSWTVRSVAEWLLSGDTGISSKTIAAIALGIEKKDGFGFDIPYDSADFGRCYRLLKAVPELRDYLPLVAEKCPKWRPLVEIWDELTRLYEQDLAEEPQYEMQSRGRGRTKRRVLVNKRRCHDRIRELREACMEAGGYTQTVPGDGEPKPACECHRRIKEHDLRGPCSLPLNSERMILCPDCGNKRCPKASDHRHSCTGSNEPGQAGSVYR